MKNALIGLIVLITAPFWVIALALWLMFLMLWYVIKN